MFATQISSYTSTLANAIDDIEDFDIPSFIVGDLVNFEPYYESDEGGVGVIKQITICEFKNTNYNPQDENSQLFIPLPCAIVVSALPNEKWLDYVPLTNIDIIDLNQFMEEYADAFPEQNASELFSVRLQVAIRLSQFRYASWASDSNLPELGLSAQTNPVPFQGGVA